MDVANAPGGRGPINLKACVALLILRSLAPIRAATASEPRTAEDDAAERELGIAAPELSHMTDLRR
jgi:hypothetical protein